jgi:phenylalanine-4-hydroxylase
VTSTHEDKGAGLAPVEDVRETTIVFSVPDKPGSLRTALAYFDEERINLRGIRSQNVRESSFMGGNEYEITVNASIDKTKGGETASPARQDPQHFHKALARVAKRLEKAGMIVRMMIPSTSEREAEGRGVPVDAFSHTNTQSSSSGHKTENVPWFPRRLSDLDRFATRCLQYGSELDADHPGFHDKEYRKRREVIASNAARHRHGQPLPSVEYTTAELQTWKIVYGELAKLRETHTSRRYQHALQLLEREMGFGPNCIPQLSVVSNFLNECTGWSLRPVMGLLSSRDFLNGLAFRVFHSTQYVRHHSQPLYTPEPDVCHELLGHIPMLCDEAFSELNQVIGLASLGASDEDIERLARCYWFSVEFGLCREGSAAEVRAYGAGLLSSFGELRNAIEGQPQTKPWNPFEAAKQTHPVTEYQPLYFVAESLEDAVDQLRAFAETLQRPFELCYNPYSRTVSVVDNGPRIAALSMQISHELRTLTRALRKLEALTAHNPEIPSMKLLQNVPFRKV